MRLRRGQFAHPEAASPRLSMSASLLVTGRTLRSALRNGPAHAESRAGMRIVDLHAATMCERGFLDDGESDAGAAHVGCLVALAADERFEDSFFFIFRHTSPRVLNRQLTSPVVDACAHDDDRKSTRLK